MSRKVCITAVDGQTGFLIAELLLTEKTFSSKIDAVLCVTLDPESEKAAELQTLGASIVPYQRGHGNEITQALQSAGCDTLCLVPPARKDKFDISAELTTAAAQAGVANVLLISSAGCDYADPVKQPRLREFIELETLVLSNKGDASVPLGHSPCVIRAEFYAENLLLYAPQAQRERTLPLPIGTAHKFAPVALGDIAQVAAHVLSGKGQHGFDDKHRGQMMVVTGPMLATGDELASAASKGLGVKMQFKDISTAEAKKVLKAQSESDESELEYLLEYYSLVKEGKTNYIATTAFHDVTGTHPQEPDEFFRVYSEELGPRKKARITRQ